jgi:hypothetical protein
MSNKLTRGVLIGLAIFCGAVKADAMDVGAQITFNDPYPVKVVAGCTFPKDAEKVDYYRSQHQYYDIQALVDWVGAEMVGGKLRACIVMNEKANNSWRVITRRPRGNFNMAWFCLENANAVDFSTPDTPRARSEDTCYWIRLPDKDIKASPSPPKPKYLPKSPIVWSNEKDLAKPCLDVDAKLNAFGSFQRSLPPPTMPHQIQSELWAISVQLTLGASGQFAVFYIVGGATYWDNNFGANYSF